MGKPNGYWTYERCKDEALKYTTRSEFQKTNGGCYEKARKCCWLDDICVHMIIKKHKFGYWNNIENCKREISLYTNRTEFKKKCGFLYKKLCKSNELEIALSDIKKERRKSKLNKEICINVIKNCKTKKEFYKNHLSEYRFSIKNGFYDEISKHLIGKYKQPNYWNNIEICHKESLKYDNRNDFRKKSYGAYLSATKNNWLNKICSHMLVIGSKYERLIYVFNQFNENIINYYQ